MKLGEYLKANGLTQEQFGAEIGRTAATVSRIVAGIHKPDWETMQAIASVTGGKVSPNDFLASPDPPDRPPVAAGAPAAPPEAA